MCIKKRKKNQKNLNKEILENSFNSKNLLFFKKSKRSRKLSKKSKNLKKIIIIINRRGEGEDV